MALFARWHGAVLAVALSAVPSSAVAGQSDGAAATGYRHRPMCVSRTAPDTRAKAAVKSAAPAMSASRARSEQKPST